MNEAMHKPAAVPESTEKFRQRDLFRYADGILTCNFCNCSNPVRFGSNHYTDCRLFTPAASLVAGVGAEKNYHFSDEQVRGALVGTDYLRDSVLVRLSHMTSGEKWSLYRAIVKLAKEDRNG